MSDSDLTASEVVQQAARKKAVEVIERLCADPAMWATHGMPNDAKLRRLEDEFAAAFSKGTRS